MIRSRDNAYVTKVTCNGEGFELLMEAPPSHTAKPEPVVVIEESEGKGRHRRSISGARNFFAGGCGGVCGITIGHPFDTIKVTRCPSSGQMAQNMGATCWHLAAKENAFRDAPRGGGESGCCS